MRKIILLVFLSAILIIGILSNLSYQKIPSENISNPTLSIYAKDLGGNPRVLALDPNGNLITSLTDTGKIIALPDKEMIASGLKHPHGLLFANSKLYVAEENELISFDYDANSKKATNKNKVVNLPNGGVHFTRTLILSPNKDKILIAIGSTCNVCNDDKFRAQILSVNFDGSDLKTYASGLRNSVFMQYRPNTNELWATEMGRDYLGDDLPPDEMNIIKENSNYGWPICYGKNIHDTNFDKNVYIKDPCSDKTPSQVDFQAHSAPLGFAFLDQKTILVAFHGSWNRTVPTGHKIVKVTLDNNGNLVKTEDFINDLGRPVDILNDNGKIYISDDKAGIIYLLQLAS